MARQALIVMACIATLLIVCSGLTFLTVVCLHFILPLIVVFDGSIVPVLSTADILLQNILLWHCIRFTQPQNKTLLKCVPDNS